ncbi:uncharacterized protein LOC110226869, partial [Arabidopsis lyrata subsp. lyrata]|uniref:uncharacterized protein LOC110226869 n=1 Tax=Arabidopsis lyrata subsp. lyrata TaxID=81972 RepID=UPI000A29D5CE
MGDYSDEEEDSYESSSYESDYDEQNKSWFDEDDGYEGRSWCEDYSSSEFGYEPDGEEREPEPPDPAQDTTSHQGWYRGETDQESNADEPYGEKSWCESEEEETHQENRPWCEIPYSDPEEEHQEEDRPWCEIPEDDYDDASNDGVKPWCEETDSQISLDESQASNGDEPESKEDFAQENEAKSEAGRDDSGEEYTEADEDVSVVGRDEVRYINFAGHHQGPKAYLRWEQEIEDWLSSNQIPEKEKTIYAEDTLTEDAFRHWEQDAYIRLEYDEPEATWEEMKQLMYGEYVEKAGDELRRQIKVLTNPKPRRMIVVAAPQPTPKSFCCPGPKKVSQDMSKKPNKSTVASPAKRIHQEYKSVAHKAANKPLLKAQGNSNKGPKEITHKDAPLEKNLLLDQAEHKEASPPKVNKTEVTKRVTATRKRSHAPEQNRGDIVSRSKPFQEGEYDEDIKSSSTKDQGENTDQPTKNPGENKHERTKDICVFLA